MNVEADSGALRIRMEAPSALSARATLEDLLACIQAAERTLGVKAGAASGAAEG